MNKQNQQILHFVAVENSREFHLNYTFNPNILQSALDSFFAPSRRAVVFWSTFLEWMTQFLKTQ